METEEIDINSCGSPAKTVILPDTEEDYAGRIIYLNNQEAND